MPELYRVGNPINREERVNLNETFDDILRRFSSMQNTLNLLTGNQDVQNLLDQIDSLIQQAETSLDEIQNAIQSSQDATGLANSATSNANLAASNANDEAQRAEDSADYIDSVKAQIDYFIGEQTNLQAQINQLVVSGDSSPEAAQARVGYTGTNYASLKARLDAEANLSIPGSNAYILNIANESYTADNYKNGITITMPPVLSTNSTYMFFIDITNNALGTSFPYTGNYLRFRLITYKRSDSVQVYQDLEVRSNAAAGYGTLFCTISRQLNVNPNSWSVSSNTICGSGNPNGSVGAIRGTLYLDYSNGDLYSKSTGITAILNTGWSIISQKNKEFNEAVLTNGFQGSVKYKKANDGLVTVRIRLTSVPTNSNGVSIANIPEGFRPLNNLPSTATIFNGASFVQVANPYTLRTNGNIVYINGDITSPNTNIYNSEVSYYVDL